MDPDDFEPMRDTPLLEVVRIGTVADVRRRLAETTTDIDRRDHIHDSTALELALALRRLDVARLLLEAGADPNAPSAHDADALAVAIDEFAADARAPIELLLASGARPTHGALVAAANAGDLWAVDRLSAVLSPAGTPVRDDAIEAALLAAAVRRDDHAFFDRVRARGDALPPPYLQQAFDAAADSGHSAMWDRLVPLGAPDLARATAAAMLGFLREGRAEQLALLRRLAHDGGPAVAGQLYAFAVTSPLALVERREALLSLAIECRGDLEARDSAGMTALLLAAGQHDVAGMRRLIDLGADRHVRDHLGRGLSAHVERWPQSTHLAAARAFLAQLGVPVEPPAQTFTPAPLRDPTGLAVVVGLVLGVLIVAVVLLLHALGLL